jgi:hypothetical protein
MFIAKKNTAALIVLLLVGVCIGCAKEYSFEGTVAPPVRTDTTIITPPPPPYFCQSCVGKDAYEENRWSFYEGNIFYCGIIDTAIVAPLRGGFTFFGPSACSPDSGSVYTVSFENGLRLDRDMTNISTPRGSFYYYDNPGQTFLYMNISNIPFTFVIQTYDHQTKMATGTFSGSVRNAAGTGRNISGGKFKVRLL